jgi:membrane-associated phospholipid phosphatase
LIQTTSHVASTKQQACKPQMNAKYIDADLRSSQPRAPKNTKRDTHYYLYLKWFSIWCAALLVALLIDRPIATWVHDSGLSDHLKSAQWRWLTVIGRIPGNFLELPLILSVFLFLLGRRWWPAGALIFLSGVFAGINAFFKWIFGRARPFNNPGEMFRLHPFVKGFHGFFHPVNQSFPSGDVCLAAATASSLFILFPRQRWIWAGLVIMVAVERVAEGAHYPSDTVAAAGLGWLAARCAWHLLGRPKRPADVPISPPADMSR